MDAAHRLEWVAETSDEARMRPPETRPGRGASQRREAAVAADGLRASTGELGEFWLGILRGELVISDCFSSPRRWYLTLRKVERPVPLAPSSRAVLTSLLLGEAQKCTAINLKVSPSTVSTAARRILRDIGLAVAPGRIPPALAILARASRGQPAREPRITILDDSEGHCAALSFDRPELRLARQLSPAEYNVTGLMLEGLSYREIAVMRKTSTRTIANQISSVFRRLSVSGRGELIRHLTQGFWGTDGGNAPASRRPT
jgi:DNA-binding CsgD family transcriptional regulator